MKIPHFSNVIKNSSVHHHRIISLNFLKTTMSFPVKHLRMPFYIKKTKKKLQTHLNAFRKQVKNNSL